MTNYWDASKIRYIKLGESGRWWPECIKDKIIKLGFNSGDPELLKLSREGKWELVKHYWSSRSGTSTAHTNAMREFFEDDGNTLWVTFQDGCMYYGYSDGGNIFTNIDTTGEPITYRKMNDLGWRNTDLNGDILRFDELSGKLTKTAGFRMTICKFSEDVENYIRRKISAKPNPLVIEAEKAKDNLAASLEDIIKLFTWKDFELLIDLIFSNSGWKRISSIGGSQKTTDLDLINPVTDDLAFVQIKSSTNQSEFEDYVKLKSLEKSEYQRMFYVYHTGSLHSSYEDVVVWDLKKVCDRVIETGLINWVIGRAK